MYKVIFLLVSFVTFASAGHWTVQNAANKTCLIVDADVSGQIKWTEGNETKSFDFVVNGTSRVDSDESNCYGIFNATTANVLKVLFLPNGANSSALTAQEWELKLIFTQSEKKDTFSLANYELVASPTQGLNFTSKYFKSDKADIDVTATGTNGFKCSETGLALNNDSTVQLKNLRVIAFAALEAPEFPKGQMFEQCMLDAKTSDIVPIVVGACLAGLVIVVLIAYLIGRARAKRQGYASV